MDGFLSFLRKHNLAGFILLATFLLFLCLAFGAGCGEPGPLSRIDVTPAQVIIKPGSTQQFTAKGYDASGNAVSITPTWACSNTQVGAIDSNGLFTAVANGTCEVTATSGTIVGKASVTVADPPLVSIKVTPAEVAIDHGSTKQFEAKGYDASGNEVAITPTWSCDSQIGTVSSSGLFTASGYGTGSVTATAKGVSGSPRVQVPTYLSGTLSSDMTLHKKNNPYIFGNFNVPTGVTLTIEAGVVLKTAGCVYPSVSGTIICQGTDSDPVYFTSIKDDTIWGDTNNDGGAQQPSTGCFEIFLNSSTTESQLDYTFFRYGGSGGSSNPTMQIDKGSHKLRNCHFEDCCCSAIGVGAASPDIESCTISNSGYGMWLSGGSPTVSGCTIQDITYAGIWVRAGSTPTIGGRRRPTGNELLGKRCSTGINAAVSEGSPPNPTITSNTINDCTGYAINLGYDSTNNVRNNKGSGNGINGIGVGGTYQV